MSVPGSVVHVDPDLKRAERASSRPGRVLEEKDFVVALVPHAGCVAWTERAFVQWFVLLALRK